MKDIAAVAGVAVATVSNAINRPEIVAPGTLERVLDTIDRLGFVRDESARRLRSAQSAAIGVIIDDLADPFLTAVIHAAQERAGDRGHSIVIGSSESSAELRHSHLRRFAEQRARGVIIAPRDDADIDLRLLDSRRIPAVILSSGSGLLPGRRYAVDDTAAGYRIADHLVAGGRARIAFVQPDRPRSRDAPRLDGMRARLAGAGARLDILQTAYAPSGDGYDLGRRLASRPRTSRPDAIVAASAALAMDIVHGLRSDGTLRIPEDIAMAAFDDAWASERNSDFLTTIRQPVHRIGADLVDRILEAAPSDVVDVAKLRRSARPELVVGTSSQADTGTTGVHRG